MVLFFGASAWVEAQVRETETDTVLTWRDTGTPAISRPSCVELPSSFARRRREGVITQAQQRQLLDHLDHDLRRTLIFDVMPEIMVRARRLLERHPQRASDAVQLGTCVYLRDPFTDVELCAFDARVCQAARADGVVLAAGAGGMGGP